MIHLHDIRKTYLVGEEEVHALDGVSLTIHEGEFVAIIGTSGSGKSTLMNIIGFLDTADSGRYVLDGDDVTGLSEHQLGVIRNRKIGFIFQQFNLLYKLTTYENVELPLIYQGLPRDVRQNEVIRAIDKVGLSNRMHHRPNQLSGGQQQRVAVARALATHPSLILADEPTGNLDSSSSRDIMRLLHELHSQGNTILLITHDHDIAKEADRQVRIFDGKIISDTTNNTARTQKSKAISNKSRQVGHQRSR